MKLFTVGTAEVRIDVRMLALCVLWLFSGNFSLFVSLGAVIIVHEAAHAFCAFVFGLEVKEITLYLFGGATVIRGIEENGVIHSVIALAGPFISLLSGYLLSLLKSVVPTVPEQIISYSYMVAMFNLLPIYPLDGGRVLQSVLLSIFGIKRGMRICKRVSVVSASLLLTVSVAELIFFQKSNMLLMSLFLFTATLKEIKKPRKSNFGASKSKNVKLIRVMGEEKILDISNDLYSSGYHLVLVTDKTGKILGFLSEQEIENAVLLDSTVLARELLIYQGKADSLSDRKNPHASLN